MVVVALKGCDATVVVTIEPEKMELELGVDAAAKELLPKIDAVSVLGNEDETIEVFGVVVAELIDATVGEQIFNPSSTESVLCGGTIGLRSLAVVTVVVSVLEENTEDSKGADDETEPICVAGTELPNEAKENLKINVWMLIKYSTDKTMPSNLR